MRLRTIGLISTLAIGLLAAPLPAKAQQAGKVYRIGYLEPRPAAPKEFRQGLRELGYVEGKNIVIEPRFAKGKSDRFPGFAAELVRLRVDVIVTVGNPAARAAKNATTTIPIVMLGAGDPIRRGLVASMARPGGNITGLTNIDSKLHAKRLELLKEAFPRISRVAIFWTRGQQKRGIREVKAAGQALGIQIQPSVIGRRPSTLDSAFSAISQERPDGLMVATSGLIIRHRARIFEFAANRRLPAIYGVGGFAKWGGLMSYGADRQHMYRRVAFYVDKILKGAKPADLPIEQPSKFDLVINLKTAKQIDVTISPAVLLQATKVIK
jgi:putative ABC transport system substrate-binding protein